MPAGRRKAGNVMRLKMPKATSEPSTAEESSEDRFWDLSAAVPLLKKRGGVPCYPRSAVP